MTSYLEAHVKISMNSIMLIIVIIIVIIINIIIIVNMLFRHDL